MNRIECEKLQSSEQRDPKESIVKGGVIGIDFGTKSTVVVYQKNSEDHITT